MRAIISIIVLGLMAGLSPVMAETCIASVYGTRDHDQNGTKTASGIPLRDDVATIALPDRKRLRTHARVTNVKTGLSKVFHVTDFGPFKDHRCADLSHQAARDIGCPVNGLCRVSVE